MIIVKVPLKMFENLWKSMEVFGNHRTFLEIFENPWKSVEICNLVYTILYSGLPSVYN